MHPALQTLIQAVAGHKASDLFLKGDVAPRVRIDGQVRPLETAAPGEDELESILQDALSKEQFERFQKEGEMDFSLEAGDLGRFRVNAYRQWGGIAMALRHVPPPNFTIESLRLPTVVRTLAEKRRGLVLVTGATGSGKSTTLAAMIQHINATRYCHIVSVEDPIEFRHKDHLALISQREVGQDTLSFNASLRHVLRQSPDVILIGEMRDLETIQTALTAAETGHLVLSTLHTTDAVQTVNRIINYFPGHLQSQIRQELTLCLAGIISQRLLALKKGRGRVAATEILVATPAIRKLLYEGKTWELKNLIADGGNLGMMTFDQSLTRLYHDGLISMEEALAQATSPDEFRLAAQGISSEGSRLRKL